MKPEATTKLDLNYQPLAVHLAASASECQAPRWGRRVFCLRTFNVLKRVAFLWIFAERVGGNRALEDITICQGCGGGSCGAWLTHRFPIPASEWRRVRVRKTKKWMDPLTPKHFSFFVRSHRFSLLRLKVRTYQ